MNCQKHQNLLACKSEGPGGLFEIRDCSVRKAKIDMSDNIVNWLKNIVLLRCRHATHARGRHGSLSYDPKGSELVLMLTSTV
jgi:hypothetical protein